MSRIPTALLAIILFSALAAEALELAASHPQPGATAQESGMGNKRIETGTQEFESDTRLQFSAETFDRTRSTTSVLFGPDRRLYAASAFGSNRLMLGFDRPALRCLK